jgi:hypothetical protein
VAFGEERDSSLDALIAFMRMAEGTELSDQIAARAAEKMQLEITRTLSAGTTPEGGAWAPRRKDGGRAYANAASKVTTQASGSLIRMVLKGPEVYGHFGGKGRLPRTMLPDAGAGVPPSVAESIRQATTEILVERLSAV